MNTLETCPLLTRVIIRLGLQREIQVVCGYRGEKMVGQKNEFVKEYGWPKEVDAFEKNFLEIGEWIIGDSELYIAMPSLLLEMEMDGILNRDWVALRMLIKFQKVET